MSEYTFGFLVGTITGLAISPGVRVILKILRWRGRE